MIREIKGRHVLIGLLIFFGIIIAVDAYFVTTALRTFRGEDEPRSYVQGINYNDVLDRREEQAALGWSATSVVTSSRVEIGVTDAQGAPVTGLVMDARLRHPADSGRDIALALSEISAGLYEADTDVPAGRWTLVVSTPEGPPFELEQDIWLQ